MQPDPSMMAGFSGPPDLSLLQVAFVGVGLLLVFTFIMALCALISLPLFFGALGVMELMLLVVQNAPDPLGKFAKLSGLVFRSLRRSLIRTALTYVALFVLTGMLTLIYGLVSGISSLTAEKDGAQFVILTEKFSIPSQMPPRYFEDLKTMLKELPPRSVPRPLSVEERTKKGLPMPTGRITSPTDAEVALYFSDRPDTEFTQQQSDRRKELIELGVKESTMTWSFVAGTFDKAKPTKENSLFFFALDAEAIADDMMSSQGMTRDDVGKKPWEELLKVLEMVKSDKRNCVIGEDKLKQLNKNVGDTVKVSSLNYTDIEFDLNIVGAFPSGSRLGNAAALRYDYFVAKLDEYKQLKGVEHPVSKSLNLVWVRVPDKRAYEDLAEQVNLGKTFNSPAAKIETFSAIVSSFLDSLKDILWGLKWIIMPSIVAIMCLVIGITITIGVRERLPEMAVLKVLGFQPWHVMAMIIAEAVLIGLFGGMLSTWLVGGLPRIANTIAEAMDKKNPLDFLKMPIEILVIGPVLGVAVGFIGSVLPSWTARTVKVSQIFAQVS